MFQALSESIAGTILSVLTVSYSGAYAYHTVNPIEAIREYQHDTQNLIEALAHFRQIKNEELIFVQRAVSLDVKIHCRAAIDIK